MNGDHFFEWTKVKKNSPLKLVICSETTLLETTICCGHDSSEKYVSIFTREEWLLRNVLKFYFLLFHNYNTCSKEKKLSNKKDEIHSLYLYVSLD